MKSKTVSVLDELLNDLGRTDIRPQQADEFTSADLADKLGIVHTTASNKLLALMRAGKYTRRKIDGGAYVYRKAK
jgi:predicted transcriptional regulator